VVKHHFKLGPECDDADFHVAAHHCAPLLTRRNYEGSTGTRVSRKFKTLLTKLEAASCCCSMEEPINNFESCMKRAGVSIPKMDKRRLLLTQGPTNTSSSVRSYFEGLWRACGPSPAANPRGRKPRTIGSSRGSGIGVSTSVLPCPPISILSWPNSLGFHLPNLHKRQTSQVQ
jgi:hypothetical protein